MMQCKIHVIIHSAQSFYLNWMEPKPKIKLKAISVRSKCMIECLFCWRINTNVIRIITFRHYFQCARNLCLFVNCKNVKHNKIGAFKCSQQHMHHQYGHQHSCSRTCRTCAHAHANMETSTNEALRRINKILHIILINNRLFLIRCQMLER